MYLHIALSLSCLFIGCYGASSTPPDNVTYVGCYNTSSLSRGYSHIMFDFSMFRCFELCSGLASPYAGINKVDYTCYCINKSASEHMEVDGSLCLPCSEDKSKTCGGNQTLSLYEVKQPKSMDMKIMVAWDNEVDLLDVTVPSNQTLVHSLAPVTGVDYHYLRQEGYAAWEDQIYRFPLFSNESVSPTLVANISSFCPVFAVDWVNDRLIWPLCGENQNAIMMADLDFSHQEKLVDLAEKGHHLWMKDIVVDPYNGLLFWIEGTSLLTIRLEGTDLKIVNAKLPAQDISNLAVDTAVERVYFSGYVKKVAYVFYTDYGGSVCHSLTSFSQDNHQVLSLSVFRSEVYLMSQFLYNNDVHLYKISTSDNGANKEDMMDVGKMVTQMRIFHPDVQSPAKVDVCVEEGCSHHCFVDSSAVRCLCPLRFELGSDEKTCELAIHNSFFVNALIGLGSVTFILLSAGVLMCISDKLWSKIRPSIVRVTPNILKQPVLYKRGQDDANLI